MEDAILARGLRKAYGKVQALDGLDLRVARGTIFGLLGPNGAGKSTTVKILTTLSRPDSGEARVAGLDVLTDPQRVRRAIGVVGQRPGSAEEATGRENLVLQGELYGLGRRELKRRVGDVLERFDLAEAADRPVRTYSGGMQRRLDVALGLLHSPQVLFLDEPTTGLDPEVRAALWAEIERLARDEQMTILLTTHYLEEADRLASELAIVDRGRVVAQGSPDALKSELQGDAVHVELAEAEPEATIQAGLRASASCSACRSTVGSCTRAQRTARRRCRPCWRRWSRPASRSPRCRWRVPRSTRCTCGTRGGHSKRQT